MSVPDILFNPAVSATEFAQLSIFGIHVPAVFVCLSLQNVFQHVHRVV